MGPISRGVLLALLAIRALSFSGRGLALVWFAELVLRLWTGGSQRSGAPVCVCNA